MRQLMEAQRESLFEALPRHVTPDRMIRAALTSLRRNPKLLDCTPESFFGALTEASSLGLEVDGVLGYAYMVPFKDQCTLIAGYKGLIDVCRRSGTISTITMEAVHQGDEFTYQLGDSPLIRHVPNDTDPHRDAKPISHVYVVVVLRDGGVQRKVWSRAKIDAHKERYSRGWNKADSAWKTSWVAMAKKTVIRDMINRGEIPASVEIQRLTAREEIMDVATISAPSLPAEPGVSRSESLMQRLSEPDPTTGEAPSFNPPTPEEQAAAEASQVNPAVENADGVDQPPEPTSDQEEAHIAEKIEKATTLTAVKDAVGLAGDGENPWLHPEAIERLKKKAKHQNILIRSTRGPKAKNEPVE